MDEVRVKSRLFLFILAANLLHDSLGQRSRLQIAFSNDPNEVTLECLDEFGGRPATFTFWNSAGMESSNTTTAGRATLTISIRPENEAIVSCTIAGLAESERVAITGEYTVYVGLLVK